MKQNKNEKATHDAKKYFSYSMVQTSVLNAK